jgi:hypothetical protein
MWRVATGLTHLISKDSSWNLLIQGIDPRVNIRSGEIACTKLPQDAAIQKNTAYPFEIGANG